MYVCMCVQYTHIRTFTPYAHIQIIYLYVYVYVWMSICLCMCTCACVRQKVLNKERRACMYQSALGRIDSLYQFVLEGINYPNYFFRGRTTSLYHLVQRIIYLPVSICPRKN